MAASSSKTNVEDETYPNSSLINKLENAEISVVFSYVKVPLLIITLDNSGNKTEN